MRRRTFLLVTTALSSATMLSACRKESGPPGNPKGSVYDGDAAPLPLPANPKGSHYDDGQNMAGEDGGGATADADAGAPIILRMPANPKGTHYDAGSKPVIKR